MSRSSTPATCGTKAREELARLWPRLVHLPVARHERARRQLQRACSRRCPPGGPRRRAACLPSRNSIDAPPPVETWSNMSSSPKRRTALTVSPPPTTVHRAAAGDRLADGARADGEVVDLEQAHRPVPEDGAGAGEALGEGGDRRRADVETHVSAGMASAATVWRAAPASGRRGHDDVGRQLEGAATGSRLRGACRGPRRASRPRPARCRPRARPP